MATMSMGEEKPKLDEATYRRRIRAWAMYDWANSAFATTILAALLPPYFSAVAGATLPSAATATAYWGLTLSISTFIVAILSPILGTISDIKRGKKAFLAFFTGVGVVGTGLLVFISTGDWLMAALFFVLGRIGFSSALVFYDALLPHVAREEDQDKVSAQGFALGYLGGGILLAINVAMFTLMPDTPFEYGGIRLSFLTVAIWWIVFSIPLFRDVPEPPSATAELGAGDSLIKVSFGRLMQTLRELSQYRELFKYLVAFLIFNDPINTIIGLAAIYGAELGFGTTELVLALLLVQFVGIPFTLIFGNLPSKDEPRRHYYLAYVLFNLVMLPTVAIIGAQTLPTEITGNQPPPYVTEAEYLGEGVYPLVDADWNEHLVTGQEQIGEGFLGWLGSLLEGTPEDQIYYEDDNFGRSYDFAFNGQNLKLTYAIGAEQGRLGILVDGEALADDEGNPVLIEMHNETVRYNVSEVIELPDVGQHIISFVNASEGAATGISIASIEVLPPKRVNNLGAVIGILFGLQAVGVVFAFVFGRFFKGLALMMDTRTGILLAILMYTIIAIWGFFLNSTIEFWFLAWMVATVQGGSQALSRSLYSSMSPSSKSGEFFGLFSILSKGASVLGTGIFSLAVLLTGSSRPAILSLVILFALGAFLLTRVNIEEGRRLAKEEDAEIYGTA